jgi:hypothetical protein
MNNLETQIKEAAEKAVIKFIQDGGWLMPNYESRFKIPGDWVASCWELVDRDSLKAKIASRLESELADRMVNHMAAELATDIKQILSVQERREMLRSIARDHMDAVMKAGTGK